MSIKKFFAVKKKKKQGTAIDMNVEGVQGYMRWKKQSPDKYAHPHLHL